MFAQYKPNEKDQTILNEITDHILRSLREWYGEGSSLESTVPEVRSYRNSFILCYPVTNSTGQKKHILVKIRRNPKMNSLFQAIQADIHQNMEPEYKSLKFVHDYFSGREDDFGTIRPLDYIGRYQAIVMEENPSRTLRRLLTGLRSSKTDWDSSELRDAARKTGRWLYYFHHRLNSSFNKNYTTGDILQEARDYAQQIESVSRRRVQAGPIMDAFSKKLEDVHIEQVTFSHTHADMTIDNVLYSNDRKVCLIDIKNRLAPVYVDLGLILTHPETSKSQIFSAGNRYPEVLLRKYRREIIAGYFDEKPGNETLIQIYCAIMVLNKWLMYEELMNRYRGVKRWLAIPAAPFVSAYFQNLLKKYLGLIQDGETVEAAEQNETTVDTSL